MLKHLFIALISIIISGCLSSYVLLTSIYEVPSRSKPNKYYSFSIAIDNSGIKKNFTGSVLCKHSVDYSLSYGWWDYYSTKVTDIFYSDNLENSEWQLKGVSCPNKNKFKLPTGLYRKNKNGEIYYLPFFNDTDLASISWSLDLEPKYKVYTNTSTILEKPNESPKGYMYVGMKLLKVPYWLELVKTPTVIGDNGTRCNSHPLRQIYTGRKEDVFNRLNRDYMQRGILNYHAGSDTWFFGEFNTKYRFIDVVGNRKKDFKHFKDDCINLRIENNIYPIAPGELIWFPDDKFLMIVDYHGFANLKKTMYIDAIKECNNIPIDVLRDIEKYGDFKEVLRSWIPDEEKNSQYPVKKHAVLMKVKGSLQCVNWPSDAYSDW